MAISKSASRRIAGTIIILYAMLGALYALETPKWQIPDEPAHFNYVQYVALKNELPVLQAGDYPHQYLEEIKRARFPPQMSIAPIRYESWQPPLYYSLAAVVYRLTDNWTFEAQFLALRLFSVALGAAVLWVICRIAQEVFPDSQALPLAATAFAATIPMHLATSAGIGNDVLAELLLLLILWQSIGIARQGLDLQRGVTTGVLLGLALLTKTTIYVGVAVVAVAVLLHKEPSLGHRPRPAARKAGSLLGVFAVAMLFGAPWFMRNLQVYGNWDLLAWQRHDTVVAGQLRTADLLGDVGWAGLLGRFAQTTFRSFWAQFGWMGVLVDQRIYLSLALVSALLGLGLILFLARVWRGRHSPTPRGGIKLTTAQGRGLLVLGTSALLTALLYLGYNLKFVQHQGRYLFPALGPLALGAALSMRELLRPKTARLLAAALWTASLLLVIGGALSGDMPMFGLVLLVTTGGLLASAAWLPERWGWLAPTLLYAAFLMLDWISLYWYLVPGTEILPAG